MIEIAFRSNDGPILVQIHAPVATQDEHRPWTVEVRLDGRPSNAIGWDMLGAMEGALHLLSGYLSGREGLDPPVVALPLNPSAEALADGLRQGLLAVLEARGIPCPEDASTRIAACADPEVLQRILARAKTASGISEVFAAETPPSTK